MRRSFIMRKARLENHLKQGELRKRMMEAKNREQFQRWQAIFLTSKGLRAEQVAEYVGVSRGTVHQWVFQYNHVGPEGFRLRGRGGRRFGLLTFEEEATLLESLRSQAEQGRVIAAFSVRAQVEKKVDQPVSKDYLYDLLHRHGWRKVMPRPQHPQADAVRQATFKKNFRSWWVPPPKVSPPKIADP
jgi:transposase